MTVNFSHIGTQCFFTDKKITKPFKELQLPFNHQFSPKRLYDFSTGRYCAIKSLEQLGIKDAIIPIGKDREPIWPEGIVGSISHCDILTGAIVAKVSEYNSLGLDIEEIDRVTPDIWGLVFTENEKRYLNSLLENEQVVQSTAIFSAKEAFYKFQYPITKTFLDFLDVEVALPRFTHLKLLSNAFASTTIIHKNKLLIHYDQNLIVSLVLNL